MAIAKYRFDVFTGTLTLSKAFEKNASTIGSAEQKLLSEFMAKYLHSKRTKASSRTASMATRPMPR